MKLTVIEKIQIYPIIGISYLLFFTLIQLISIIKHGKIKKDFPKFRKEIQEGMNRAVVKHRKIKVSTR